MSLTDNATLSEACDTAHRFDELLLMLHFEISIRGPSKQDPLSGRCYDILSNLDNVLSQLQY